MLTKACNLQAFGCPKCHFWGASGGPPKKIFYACYRSPYFTAPS